MTRGGREDVARLLSAALACRAQGDPVAAARQLAQARKVDPAHPDVLHVGAILAHDAGREVEASRLISKAIARRPGDASLQRSRGLIARSAGRRDEAIEALGIAHAASPADRGAAQLLAALLSDAGRRAEGLAVLSAVPPAARDDEIEILRATLLLETGSFAEASGLFLRLRLARPRDIRLLTGLGRCQAALGLREDAEATFEQALKLDVPAEDGARLAWAYAALKEAKRDVVAAVKLLGTAVLLQPEDPLYRHALARLTSVEGGYTFQSTWHYTRLGEMAPDDPRIQELVAANSFAVMYLDEDGGRSARDCGDCGRSIVSRTEPLPAAGFANTPDPGRRLRIGYVSADFRLHAVANFALPLVEAHDRARFEVHGYASVPGADGVTRSFEAAFDAWHPIRAMSDEEASARIRADDIDVLVDLMGLTAECRPGIFARRPAPVQVTYLGYPATTGLDCFDARLCDADTDPPGATDAFFTEPLLRLPRLFLAYRPTSPAPEPELEPPCLRNDHVTFGTFNNPAKITRRMLGTWRRVLDAVPRSRLMLRYALNDNPVVAADLARMIREAGFDEKRVLIAPPVDGQADFMATYRDLDIALDCFPYGGTTTTCEALWMGVPVVTMAGRPHASRVGMSILRAVGLGDLVTTSQGEYVAACARLAADRARLVELRAGLRGRVRASPLGDARGLAVAIETAYKELWRRWCAGAGTAGVAGAR